MKRSHFGVLTVLALTCLVSVDIVNAIPVVQNPLTGNASVIGEGEMNNILLGKHLEENHAGFTGQPGYWTKTTGKTKVFIITDEHHNRMRVMAPVMKVSDAKPDFLRTCLEANFDRALDVRYAINDGVLWSAYLHPLKSLTKSDLDSAIEQVETLVENTGSSFASSSLFFSGGNPDSEEPKNKDSKGNGKNN